MDPNHLIYRTCREGNTFLDDGEITENIQHLTFSDRQGSLRTTVKPGEIDENLSDQQSLAEFWNCFEGFSRNKEAYFIWKFAGYGTPTHQDIATVGPYTIYNQTSGISVFHNLPLLAGWYMKYLISISAKLETIQKALDCFIEAGMVSLTTARAGDVLLVHAGAAHGVTVPTFTDPLAGGFINQQIAKLEAAKDQTSTIRAVELWIDGVYESIIKELEKGCKISREDFGLEKSKKRKNKEKPA